MKSSGMLRVGVVMMMVGLVGSGALSAQDKDKYALKVPGGLAFSEFRGYESWESIAISQSDGGRDPRESGDDQGLQGRHSGQR